MSEEEIAAECGVSRRYVNKVLAGSYAKLLAAFAASGVDHSSVTELDELFHRDADYVRHSGDTNNSRLGVILQFEELVDHAQAA